VPYVFAALVIVFAGAYVYTRKSAAIFGRLFYKTAASVMLILVAVSASRSGTNNIYHFLILSGLCFALAADILSVFSDQTKAFAVAGMFGYLCMNLLYISAFWLIAAPGVSDAVFFVLLAGTGLLACKLSGIDLNKLSRRIHVYAFVLCAMAARALSMLFVSKLNPGFALCVSIGGVLILLSNMLRASKRAGGRFVRLAGILGIATYYSGQTLVALTAML